MALKVVSIRAIVPFKLQLSFNDGSSGLFDCSQMIREPGSVSALRDRRVFSQVTLENGVPTWPNHFDISPEWLHTELDNRGELNRPLPVRTMPRRVRIQTDGE